jgi:hypothetical protein
VLDLHRQPKPLAVVEIARANQPVLPMLALDSLVVEAGADVRAVVHIANDGPDHRDVEIEVRFGGTVAVDIDRLAPADLPAEALEDRFTESVTGLRLDRLPAHQPTAVGEVVVRAPDVTGGHDLLLTVRASGSVIATNRYPMHVVDLQAGAGCDARVVGPADAALAAAEVQVRDSGPLVVAEGSLDAAVGARVRAELAAGQTVVMLAQPSSAESHYPLPVQLADVETAWGSSVFHFTTDCDALPSLPRRNVLVAEESTVQARSAIVRIGAAGFPDEPVVIAYKPVPGSITGWVVGATAVGAGRLVCCQYRLTGPAVAGDAAARALLRDVIAWAATPRAPTTPSQLQKEDGRSLTYYSYPPS